jgi:iron complex transport system ATP-binding protein
MSLIEAQNIAVQRGSRQALNNINLKIHAGEIVGVVGPNGAGKTTLLRTLAGLQKPTSGEVQFEGRKLQNIPRTEFAGAVGYLPQSAAFHWPTNVEHVVKLGRFPHQTPLTRMTAADSSAIEQAIHTAGIEDLIGRRVDQISGGECMRVHLARVLAGEHRAIIADEPITSLDPKYQLHFLAVLQRQASQGTAVAISLHDLSLASRFCHRLIVMLNGAIAIADTPELALQDTTLAAVFGVRAERLRTATGTSIIPTELTSTTD